MKMFLKFIFISFLSIKTLQGAINFTVEVNSCCATITVNIVANPEWSISVDGTIYTHLTNPTGIIEHCFNEPGLYWMQFTSPSIGSPINQSIIIESCCPDPINGFNYIIVDECCIEISVINDPFCPRDWTIEFGDGAVITRADNDGQDDVIYCYSTTGDYVVILRYDTGGGAAQIIQITECAPCFLSSLCWENFMGSFNYLNAPIDPEWYACATGVKLQLPDGTIKDVMFQSLYPSHPAEDQVPEYCFDNPSYYINYLPPISVSGGFCSITLQILAAIMNEGFSATFEPDDPLSRVEFLCNKAGYEHQYGFFFTSEVRVLNILGGDCRVPEMIEGDPDFSFFTLLQLNCE
jgi:hypothetical protein